MSAELPSLLQSLQSAIGDAQVELRKVQVAVPKRGIKKFLHDRGWTSEARQIKKIEADVNQMVSVFQEFKKCVAQNRIKGIEPLITDLKKEIPKLMQSSRQIVATGGKFFSKIAGTSAARALQSAKTSHSTCRQTVQLKLQQLQQLQQINSVVKGALRTKQEYMSKIGFDMTWGYLDQAIHFVQDGQKKEPIDYQKLMRNFKVLQNEMSTCQQNLLQLDVQRVKNVSCYSKVAGVDEQKIKQVEQLLENLQNLMKPLQKKAISLEEVQECAMKVKQQLGEANDLLHQVDQQISSCFFGKYQEFVKTLDAKSPFFLDGADQKLLQDEEFTKFAHTIIEMILKNPAQLIEDAFELSSGEKGEMISKIDDLLKQNGIKGVSGDELIPCLRMLVLATKNKAILSEQAERGMQSAIEKCRENEQKAQSESEQNHWSQKAGIIQSLMMVIAGVKMNIAQEVEGEVQ